MSASTRPHEREVATPGTLCCRGPPRRHDETSLGTAILTLVAGALLTVTTGIAAMMELEQFGPAVGGIIVFRPDAAAGERWSVTAAVSEPGRLGLQAEANGRRCVLTPTVMALDGGSLVIEARRLSRAPVYQVQWAGGHTDSPTGECGTAADLVLQRTELMRLANVAGGFNSGLRVIGP